MKRSIALFDFDGTISIRDSVEAFYKYLYHSIYFYFIYHYIFCLWDILLFRMGLKDYVELKNKRLYVHTSKFNEVDFLILTEKFYKNHFELLLNHRAIDRINWHKEEGHEVWIISASYDFILDRWCTKNGIKLITNETFWSQAKIKVKGNDVNYIEKVNRLTNMLDLSHYKDIYAYGDSEGDTAMLNIANYKFFKPFRN